MKAKLVNHGLSFASAPTLSVPDAFWVIIISRLNPILVIFEVLAYADDRLFGATMPP